MLLVLLLLLCAACPSSPGACTPAGDVAQPIKAIVIDENGAELQDGATLTLRRPPQGGFVLYAGAAAINLDPCNVHISGEVLDDSTGKPFTSVDLRSFDLASQHGGYAWPNDVLNIAACPDNLGVGVAGRSGTLSITIDDAEGRHGVFTRKVTVQCPAGDTNCACICGPNYSPGKC